LNTARVSAVAVGGAAENQVIASEMRCRCWPVRSSVTERAPGEQVAMFYVGPIILATSA